MKQVTVAIAIEQGDFFTTGEITFNEGVTVAEIANFAVNEAVSYMSLERMLVNPKSRAKLSQPFTFSIEVDIEGQEIVIPSFKSKIGLKKDSLNKLISNMPSVLLNLLLPKTINPLTRLSLLEQPGTYWIAG